MSDKKNITLDRKNITRTIVNFYVLIFALVSILIALLVVTYYLTPNNYELVKFNSDKFIQISQKEYMIGSGKNLVIEPNELTNKLIGFGEKTNLIVQNYFKSQGVICLSEELIKVKYSSSIMILNLTNKPVNLLVKFYDEKY